MQTSLSFELTSIRSVHSVTSLVLAQADPTSFWTIVSTLIRSVNGYDRVLIGDIMSAIESRHLVTSIDLSSYISEQSNWAANAVGRRLIACLLELRGNSEQAIKAWNRVIDTNDEDLPNAYLSRARLCSLLGDINHAYSDLREAILRCDSYSFLAGAAKLYNRLRHRSSPPTMRKIRIALLSSTTTDLVAPLLQLICFRDEIDAEIYVAPYGSFQQEILNPESGLYHSKPDFVIVHTNWRDTHIAPLSNSREQQVQIVVDQFNHLWEVLLQNMDCRVLQHNFDIPGIDSYGYLSASQPNGRASILHEINRKLTEIAPLPVTILDFDHISAIYGKKGWFDAEYWHLAKQYPTPDALPTLVDYYVATMRSLLGLTKKVLVLDLDNTLWGGVIGEDGLGGIRLGPPSPSGEAYQALHQYCLELKKRGILLAVCSKNNEEDAKAPFLQHDSAVLKLDDFVAFKANWQDKPSNLKEIANLLNLGLDSFVFLDDNPAERALVRRELPQVSVPEVKHIPGDFISVLERFKYFESTALSKEDIERHQSYKANVQREELKTSASSLDEFLRDLDMKAEIGPFDEVALPRVVQLIGKTNQFNLTTRRYSVEQVRHIAESSNYWTQYFKLRDRFGDNGLVGVMIVSVFKDAPSIWDIDTWLMSCRVIGRQFEQLMLETLIDDALSSGVKVIRGCYIKTAKNGMVADLYDKLGFKRCTQDNNDEVHYILDLTVAPPKISHSVRVTRAITVPNTVITPA